MLHRPIRFQITLKILKTPHVLRAMLVYVEIGADPSRLPHFPSLTLFKLGLCSVVSISLMSDSGRKILAGCPGWFG